MYVFEEIHEHHLPKLLEIYSYYVKHTTVTFHKKPLTLDEMKALVVFSDLRYQTFVIRSGEEIAGYAMVSQHKSREAFENTGEAAVYLRRDLLGKGIGSLALKRIDEYARSKGFHVLVASICAENNSSIRLFEKNGYEKCAHYREVGKKFGRWLDVIAYQKIIGQEGRSTQPPSYL